MHRLTSLRVYLLIIGSLVKWSSSVGTMDALDSTTSVMTSHSVTDEYDNSGDGSDESTYDDEGDYYNSDDGVSYGNYVTGEKGDDGNVVNKDDYDEYEVTTEDSNESEWKGFEGFTCGDGTRIGKRKVCNGLRDCYDCSDELNCTTAATTFFLCYYEDDVAGIPEKYIHEDPKCVPIEQFCDGVHDCANGVDEAQFGTGFKCTVKDRFRKCRLPDDLVCDDVTHCEDRSDLCEGDVMLPDMTTAAPWNESQVLVELDTRKQKITSVPKGFFRCLNDVASKRLISLQQVCDGEFDCDDFSDECMCEVPGSATAREICGGLCTYKLWSDQEKNSNCDECAVGEIHWDGDLAAEDADVYADDKKTCFTPKEVLSRMHQFFLQNPSSLSSGSPGGLVEKGRELNSHVIECFNQAMTKVIRAGKCDGRPECLFGEDECGIDCGAGGNQDWLWGSGVEDGNANDPPFCRLLAGSARGYTCLDGNVTTPSGLVADKLNMFSYYSPSVLICDGITNCQDGSDEAYCTKKLPCSDVNGTANGTYDTAQRCDGFPHCENSADESPELCSKEGSKVLQLPCGEATGGDSYFSPLDYMDGKFDCPTGADECPPFLNRIPEIQRLFPKIDIDKKAGISSHDRAIDDLPLQIFLVAASFVGLSALAVSLALVIYNISVTWRTFINSGVANRQIWIRNSAACLREVVVNLSMTVSKAVLCGYFAYIKIARSEASNYSALDLRWRSSAGCGIAGAVCFIGSQVPVFTLSSFAFVYWLYKICRCRRRGAKRGKSNGDANGTAMGAREHGASLGSGDNVTCRRWKLCVSLLLLFAGVILLAVIWAPVVTVAGLLMSRSNLAGRTQTYAWVHIDGAPTLLQANLIGRDDAMRISSVAATLSQTQRANATGETMSFFTFPDFALVMESAAPSLRTRVLGTYGYYGQSGACLPDFLVHTNGGVAPYDMAVSSDQTHAISLGLIIIDIVLALITMALTARYGEAIFRLRCGRDGKTREIGPTALDSTFSSCVAVEVFTWLLITSLYFLKTAVPGGFTDYAYTVWCMSVLGLNCGIVTPFILLKRKFHIQGFIPIVDEEVHALRTSDSKRIIEVDESVHTEPDETKLLTNGDSVPLPENADESGSDAAEATVALV